MWIHLMLPNDENGEFSVIYKHSRLTGGEGGDRMRWVNGIVDTMDMTLSEHWEMVKDLGA